MKTRTDIHLVIEAEGVNVEEVRKDIERYFQNKNAGVASRINDTKFNWIKVARLSTSEILDWNLMSECKTPTVINFSSPDDDGLSIDELIGGNS